MDFESTPTSIETVVQPVARAAVVSAASDISQITSTSSVVDEGRFAPGAMLGGRYRILGLLGRGGMGEVYRATDLALGQVVALKFLPEEASRNPRLLERFHGEVRVARLVSHPNVCRVFDIGEIEGTPFISMEYVDGEDLAGLLTRIGRLPGDKALQAARQLCAGLAAAHDRGVIHRDLKPQNIMINKRGDVVIMDFGLAAIADQLSGAEVRNGTPAYMAPEQLRGASVTHSSDIYALGLVLYELFTGKRPYEAKTLQHLIDLQESAHLASMTSVASDVDPAVEKVIRRCLDPHPERRPAGALAVSAALPGGDPLAAALAAGETPSPELVANAGKAEGLKRKYSVPCLLVVVISLLFTPWFYARNRAAMRAPLENSPDVLAHTAREIAASFGYTARPADSGIWIEHRPGLLGYLQKLSPPRAWDAWFTSEAPIIAVYRESPQPMAPFGTGRLDRNNPPLASPGMADLTLDGHGRLLRFTAVPPADDPTAPVAADAVFRAARLDPASFQEIPPTFVPEHASDSLRAWKGMHPGLPQTPVVVQVATWHGRVTDAIVQYPWLTQADAPSAPASMFSQAREFFMFVMPIVGVLFAALVASRNWKLGRTDRQGAFRIAVARFLLGMVVWVGVMHPAPTEGMLGLFRAAASELLGTAGVLWLVYLAIEPAVRARYPHSMITWNRLLAGRWFDPQVAGDVLIGAAVGCAIWSAAQLLELSAKDTIQAGGNLLVILGVRQWLGRFASSVSEAMTVGLIVFAVICAIRRLVRYDILAALATAVLFTMTEGEVIRARSVELVIMAGLFVTIYTVLAFVLTRIGLVATIAAVFFINGFSSIWLGGNLKTWYAPYGIASMLFLLTIAGVAFWKSLGSRDLLGGDAL